MNRSRLLAVILYLSPKPTKYASVLTMTDIVVESWTAFSFIWYHENVVWLIAAMIHDYQKTASCVFQLKMISANASLHLSSSSLPTFQCWSMKMTCGIQQADWNDSLVFPFQHFTKCLVSHSSLYYSTATKSIYSVWSIVQSGAICGMFSILLYFCDFHYRIIVSGR